MVFNRELLRMGFSNITTAENSSYIWYKKGKVTVTFNSIVYIQLHISDCEYTSLKRFYTHESLSDALGWVSNYIITDGLDK